MKRRGPGRPAKDPVDRLRARIWYWSVRGRCNLSDLALSRRFALDKEGGVPPKAFERIRQRAVVPSDGSHHNRNFNLVDRVDADPEFRGLREFFDSPYWDLVRNPSMNLEEVRRVIARTMSLLGLMRPSSRIWNNGLTEKEVIERSRAPSSEYVMGIARIVARCRLDALALLAALYRESLLLVELDHAMALRYAIDDATERFVKRFCSDVIHDHLIRYERTIKADTNEILYNATDRLLRCSTEPDKTDLFDNPCMPIIDQELWEQCGGPTLPRMSMYFTDK